MSPSSAAARPMLALGSQGYARSCRRLEATIMSDRHQRPLHRLVSRSRQWPRAVVVAVVGPLARRLFRLRVEGDEHLPDTWAGDHRRQPPVVLRPCRARCCRSAAGSSFVGKVDYLDSWKTRFVLPALGMIPVDRDNPRRALGALEQAAGVLRADELFAIYPEGTRSRDGSLHAGHTGVGHLSVGTGAAGACRPGSSAPTASSHPAHGFRGRSDRPSSASARRSTQPAIGGPVASADGRSPAT